MGTIIHEDHVICIPDDIVPDVGAHMSKPKDNLPSLPVAVLSQVNGIAQRIATIVKEFSGNEGDFIKALMIEEAVINAVSHGNGADVTKKTRIQLRATLTDGVVDLKIEIRDEGTTPFSVDDEIEEALNPDNIERPNGRGMLLLKQFAKFAIEGPELLPQNAGKRLVFTKQIPLHPNHVLSFPASTAGSLN